MSFCVKLRGAVVAVLLGGGAGLVASLGVHASEAPPGADVESLLLLARQHNPEVASMRHEASAASERIEPAGALPDPKLRMELQDITKGGEQNASIWPGRVGSTRYTLMQDVPWFGKRGLQRDVAALQAEGAQARVQGAWVDIAAGIKQTHAQLYLAYQNEGLTREILDLMGRLERVAQVRYAGGLAAQADAIRAQVELTNLGNELIMLDNEKRMLQSRLNMLLARPADAPLAQPERLRALPAPTQLTLAALQARARTRNPRLFADQAGVQAAEKSRELTYLNRYPDFSFGIAPIQSRSRVMDWELMVEINIPLQQSSRRSQEREAQAMLAAARARKEATANQVLAELAENLSALDAARRSEALLGGSLLPQAELTFKAALAGYENGKLDFSTLLDAQRQIRQAKQQLIKAQVEAQTRLAAIERFVGEDL